MFPDWNAAARRISGLFVVADAGTAYAGGFGHSGSRLDPNVSVSVSHIRGDGEIDVETAYDEGWPRELDDWRLASDWVHRALEPSDVRFPIRLEADRWEQPVAVDGVEEPFTFVGNDRSWVATGCVANAQIRLAARRWPHERLALRSAAPSEVSGEVPVRPQR